MKIWLCLDDVTNCRLIYTGVVQEVGFSGDTVTVDIQDPMSLLNKPAFFGLDSNYVSGGKLHHATSGQVYDGADGEPLHVCFGKSTPYTSKLRGVSNALKLVDLVDGLPAYCYDPSATISTSTNLHWNTGPLYGGNLTYQTYGTITRTTTNGSYRYVMFTSLAYVAAGHTLKWTEAAVVYYATVYYVGDFTYLANAYNIIIDSQTMTTSSTMATDTYAVAVGLKNYPTSGTTTVLKQHQEFTVTSAGTAVSGSNPLGLLENAVFTFAGTISPDPSTHQMFYKFERQLYSSNYFSQATVLRDLLTSAGLTIDSATFAAADAALTDRVSFSIPNIDESSFQPFEKYVNDILSSTNGYLIINASGAVEYHLLAAPSSTDVRDSDVILKDSFGATIDYQDIVTELRFVNPHLPAGASVTYSTLPKETSLKAQYLHGMVNTEEFQHCLELNGSGEVSTQDAIMALKSRRLAKYRWRTATKDVDVDLGDDVQIEQAGVLGGSGVVDAKVISSSTDGNSITVEATDLLGL